MFKLWKNCDLYAPEHIGICDILVFGDKIYKIGPDLSAWSSCGDTETLDLSGMKVCPGLVDMHIHVTGGGGEQGPASRTPEIKTGELITNGVTTLMGLLGTDGISRSLENLLFKCKALEQFGFTVKMLTGNYHYPSPTLTGSVSRDISLIDPIVGVKIAVSDHRSSNIGWKELVDLGSQARAGGMISGKKGVVIMHMGDGRDGLAPLFSALENSELPPSTFIPTHCSRSSGLAEQAVEFNKLGGTIDFTADAINDEHESSEAVFTALAQGADPSRITISSDSCGSIPVFDENGSCVSITYSTPSSMLRELNYLASAKKVPMETALRFFTQNPADVLGLGASKGKICPGADADIIALNSSWSVEYLMMRGSLCISQGQVMRKGNFE
ncbi:MAG: beta-aspartyl-peptidase [Candidatus Limivicinus sp.]|jgi:beta-aspartyl-dipeptidase (metallo-type)